MNANTSQPFILNRPDGTAVEFPILSPSDRIAFRNAFRLFRKRQKGINLKLTGATDKEVRDELDAFDARRLPERDVEDWIFDPEGQREAVLLSLRRSNPQAGESEVDALDLGEFDGLTVAAAVMRIKLVPVQEGEKKPDPTTSGTAPTGAGSLPS